MELLSFLYSSPTLNLIIVLGYLSIVLLTGLLPKLIHPNYGRLQSLRLMAIKVFFLDYNLLPRLSRKLAVLVLFFNCFVFFNSNFLSGTIQTESALLKTDEIILSDFHLLNSKKTLVTEFGDYKKLRSSPANSLLERLSKRRHLILEFEKNDGSVDRIVRQGLTSFYFLAEGITLLGCSAVLAPLASSNGLVVFAKPQKYNEWLSVFYFRRSLDEQRKRFVHRRYFDQKRFHESQICRTHLKSGQTAEINGG